MDIRDSQTLTLESGTHHLKLYIHETIDLKLRLAPQSTGSLVLEVQGDGTLHLDLCVDHDANWKYLWLNRSDEALHVTENIRMQKQATLHANYGEMTQGTHHKTTHILYEGAGSWVDVKGAVMSFRKLHWVLKADHQAKNTYAMLQCNAIVMNEGDLHLEVIGSISKGNGGSKTHQMSRILNLGEKVHGVVYPMLLIDENDVEASHAASVGQPDEEQVYYLQSRGLDREAALKLIVVGYLKPILQDIDDASIREGLEAEMEKKVNQQWL